MDSGLKRFEELCEAIRAGTSEAEAEFRDAVLPCLRTIVRRSLRRERNGSADVAHGGCPGFELVGTQLRMVGRKDETFVDRVALRQCEALIEALQSPHRPRPKETLVDALPPHTVTFAPPSSRA